MFPFIKVESYNYLIAVFFFGPPQDYRKLVFVVEHMVEAYIVVMESLAGEKSVCMSLMIFMFTLYSLLS